MNLAALAESPADAVAWLARESGRGSPWDKHTCSVIKITPELSQLHYESEEVRGRQWVCRPRRNLGILVSALTRIPASHYELTGEATVLVQLRLSGYAIQGDSLDVQSTFAALTYLPSGSRVPVTLPRSGAWFTFAVFGTLGAIHRQWRLGSEIADALGHTPESLAASRHVIRRPWQVTHGATQLLRDVLNFPFQGPVARAYLDARAQQLLCECLFALQDSRPRRQLPVRIRERIQRARALLTKSPARPHTLESLSRSLGLNRTLLADAFHAEFGETVFAFLQKERLRQAWDLLERSGEPVASVAPRVGYRDSASFSRAFKAHYGVTPRQVASRGRSTARRT